MTPSLAFAALSLGCSVPDIQFFPESSDATADGVAETSASETTPGADVAMAPAVEASLDVSQIHSDGGGDSGGEVVDDASDDVAYDGPSYCNGCPHPPMGGKCCPMNGPPCEGDCNDMGCKACGPCASPKVCCTNGPMGTCKMPPC